jgi:hypothetical protein
LLGLEIQPAAATARFDERRQAARKLTRLLVREELHQPGRVVAGTPAEVRDRVSAAFFKEDADATPIVGRYPAADKPARSSRSDRKPTAG